MTPKLTTIAQDIPQKAAIAVHLLLGTVEGKEHPAAPITLDVRLIERDSTAAPRT